MKPETKIENVYCEWIGLQLNIVALKLVFLVGRGFPDRTIFYKGRVFFIEFKVGNNDLDALQTKWRNILVKLGFNYYVCRSTLEAIKVTQKEKKKTCS